MNDQDKCPKCGSGLVPGLSFAFDCHSVIRENKGFHQSPTCLRRQRDALRAENAKMRKAIEGAIAWFGDAYPDLVKSERNYMINELLEGIKP